MSLELQAKADIVVRLIRVRPKQIILNHIKHSGLGKTYLPLLEAVKQKGLKKAEVVLHSEEVWMYCQRVPEYKEKSADVESDLKGANDKINENYNREK